MSSGKKKQERSFQTNVDNAIASAREVSPTEQAIQAQTQKWLDWDNGTGAYAGKPRNIMDSPGFSDSLDLYGTNATVTDIDRHGGGAFNLASPASGAYAGQQKQLNDFNYYNNRAANLSNAVAANKARALGQANALIGYDANRKNAAVGYNMQNQTNYYNRPQQPSIWDRLTKLALGGAQMGAMAAGATV